MSHRLKIALSGASGLVGSALKERLAAEGHAVRPLVRREPRKAEGEIGWDPARGQLQACDLEGVDAVVHLAGESIASGRWTEEKRRRIRESRVGSTSLLARTLLEVQDRPRVFVCASAVGYYGDRGNELLLEESAGGEGFLADTCRQWEEAAQPAGQAGIRVAHLRFGVVLSREGGALKPMLPLFRFGLGGRLGSGNQYWSWIGLDDAVAAACHVLSCENLSGPVNLTTPGPVTNRQFTAVLSKVLGRPALFPAPAAALRLALGQMADELLLSSARALPDRLLRTGFRFQHAELESALRHVLGREKTTPQGDGR
ncbi:MAG: TIGR01777 family oxidoreductase [Thermoguttaceae bacterium]